MFGNKAKKIAALQKRNSELEQYAPIADDIMHRIDEEVAKVAESGIFDINLILQSAESDYRQQKFLELFSRLPVEERVKMLLDTAPNKTASEMLETALSNEIARLNEDGFVESLLDKSRREQHLNLSLLPIDTFVSLYMYADFDFDDDTTPKELKKDCYAEAKIRLIHIGTGIFRIAITAMYNNSDSLTGLDETQAVKIGTKYGEDIDSNVFFRSQLYTYSPTQYLQAVKLGSGRELKLGRVKIGNEEAFIKK